MGTIEARQTEATDMTDILLTIATDPIALVIFGLCIIGGLTISKALKVI